MRMLSCLISQSRQAPFSTSLPAAAPRTDRKCYTRKATRARDVGHAAGSRRAATCSLQVSCVPSARRRDQADAGAGRRGAGGRHQGWLLRRPSCPPPPTTAPANKNEPEHATNDAVCISSRSALRVADIYGPRRTNEGDVDTARPCALPPASFRRAGA